MVGNLKHERIRLRLRSARGDFAYSNDAWTQTDEKHLVFDVIQERHENNSLKAQLVRDGNIAGILSRTTADGPAFYGYDDRGNVALLTNSAGQDVGHYRYDAFGNTLEADGARAGENPYRFSTKELHGPSGIYDFGFRFYSPGMGRWLNRDPIREAGGVNLYAMVDNNPLSSVDDYGLIPNKVDPRIIAGNQQEVYANVMSIGESIGLGTFGALDGINPFGDPLADKGYYNDSESWVGYSRGFGIIGAVAGAGIAATGAGVVGFGYSFIEGGTALTGASVWGALNGPVATGAIASAMPYAAGSWAKGDNVGNIFYNGVVGGVIGGAGGIPAQAFPKGPGLVTKGISKGTFAAGLAIQVQSWKNENEKKKANPKRPSSSPQK